MFWRNHRHTFLEDAFEAFAIEGAIIGWTLIFATIAKNL